MERDETGTPQTADADDQHVVVSARRRGARQVASTIYSALKDRAELIESGPQHLPAFRVFQRAKQQSSPHSRHGERNANTPAHRDLRFTVGIDVDGEPPVVEAAAAAQPTSARLIRGIVAR